MPNKINNKVSNHGSIVLYLLNITKKIFIALLVISLCINILMLTIPLYLMQVFDRVMSSQNYDTLIFLSIIAFIAIFTSSALEWIRGLITIRIGGWFEHVLTVAVMSTQSEQLINGNKLSLTIQTDIYQIKTFISSKLVYAFLDLPWVPIYLLVIAMLNVWLCVIVTLGAISIFITTLIYDRITKNKSVEMNQNSKELMVYPGTLIKMPTSLQAMGLDINLIEKWQQLKEQYKEEEVSLANIDQLYDSGFKCFRMCLQIIIIGVGAYLVLNNQMTGGGIIAVSLITSRALAPFEQIVTSWRNIQKIRLSWKSIIQFLDYKKIVKSGIELVPPQGKLQVEKLYYAPKGTMVLQSIDFKLPKGSMLILTGLSGSGKTTLLKLLTGILKPNAGSIILDGLDITQISRQELGPHLGYVSETIEIAYATIRETICRFDSEAKEADIIMAAKMAGCHEKILGLAEGYNSIIENDCTHLSYGLKQAIVIARAFYGNPAYLLLDDPLNHLDLEARKCVIDSLKVMKEQGKTIIISGNEPEFLKVTDYILSLDHGKCQKFESVAELKKRFLEQKNISEKKVVNYKSGEGYGF